MADERPKSGGKGDDERPKSGGKGEGLGGDGSSCRPNDAAMSILRTAADLCGFLVVAVVAPMGGSQGSASCTAASPQKLAISEVRRKAELRQGEAQNLVREPGQAPGT
jgi:hypothetical protein